MEYFDIPNSKCIERRTRDGKTTAIKIAAPSFDRFQWIPYYAVHDDSEVYRLGDYGTLLVNYRFAEKKGWI